LPKPVADSSPRGLESTTATVGQRLYLFRRTEWGRRPQRPGNQSRLRALSGFAPRQFTLENHRLPLALPQSFGKLKNFHVSLPTLSARSLHPARQKTCMVVQKLWTMIFPCGRRRKNENYYSERISSTAISITYTPFNKSPGDSASAVHGRESQAHTRSARASRVTRGLKWILTAV